MGRRGSVSGSLSQHRDSFDLLTLDSPPPVSTPALISVAAPPAAPGPPPPPPKPTGRATVLFDYRKKLPDEVDLFMHESVSAVIYVWVCGCVGGCGRV